MAQLNMMKIPKGTTVTVRVLEPEEPVVVHRHWKTSDRPTDLASEWVCDICWAAGRNTCSCERVPP